MRLKHRHETSPPNRFRSAKSGANFRRMMAIIVDEQKPVACVFDLEAASRVLKFPKRCRDLVERNREFGSQRDYSEGVMHVVFAGNTESCFPKFFAAATDQKGRAKIL